MRGNNYIVYRES